jgi:transketolase
MRPWAYSIAPFIYARPFEQTRNDVCLHNLPVVLVGNGGGYGYGVMGATHHAIEDYGVLLTLPKMRVFVPAFDGDVAPIADQLMKLDSPAYLRLGLSEEPKDMVFPAYSPWRRLFAGNPGASTLLVVGSLVGGIVNLARQVEPGKRPTVWLLSELPIAELPREFIADVKSAKHLVVVEEHVAHGGVGGMVATKLMETATCPRQFTHLAARGYVSGRYGSQAFHRKECGLDAASVISVACQI